MEGNMGLLKGPWFPMAHRGASPRSSLFVSQRFAGPAPWCRCGPVSKASMNREPMEVGMANVSCTVWRMIP